MNIDERWHLWGPYLSERAWGTVREDYSANGDAWNYFPHDHARSRAFRWGEDGIGGISDFKQRLCLAFAFWNGRDPFLKERFFGVTGPQGSHGEDVKEVYFYTDSTPTHSYMRMLYRYPQARFPYEELVAANQRPAEGQAPEFELWDTGILREQPLLRYLDLEYAKVDPDDFFIRVTATNRGPEAAICTSLPTLWFRNTWSWGRDDRRPILAWPAPIWLAIVPRSRPAIPRSVNTNSLRGRARTSLHRKRNQHRTALFDSPNSAPIRERWHQRLHRSRPNRSAVNPEQVGTKAAAHYAFTIEPGASQSVRLWFGRVGEATDEDRSGEPDQMPRPASFRFWTRMRSSISNRFFKSAQGEADEFYQATRTVLFERRTQGDSSPGAGGNALDQTVLLLRRRRLARRRSGPAAATARAKERGATPSGATFTTSGSCRCRTNGSFPGTRHGTSRSIASRSPLVDPHFAKGQLDIILREWYQHPNGQIPAYEWNFERRQSAGDRMGRVARLQDRGESSQAKAIALFSKPFSTNCSSPLPGG